ncbi:hypothetical protein F4781DRAFT_441707 [Annulohypoxylon bovei var. microspora]|nr:hypothetical protein F4781DRAFT_441707 [Annulohypoxylon bovei var. microspora]
MADESMTTCEGMPPDGSIAIANWGGDNSAIYYTDTSNGVRQRTYDQGRWDGGTKSDILFEAKTATPLAAMQWFKTDNVEDNNSIRFYHLDNMCRMKERCWDGPISNWSATSKNNWGRGELDLHTAVTAGNSKMASVHWAASLRVIYQAPDGSLREHCRDRKDPWYAGSTLPCPAGTRPYSGTAIAAVSRNPSAPELFVFFQCEDSNVYMAKYLGSWSVGGPLFKAQRGSGLAAVIRPSENAIQVFCANEYGTLTKHKGEPGEWKTTPGDKELLENTAIAGRVYKRKADQKEMVALVFVLKINGQSREAALATAQGRRVFSGRIVPEFLNLTQKEYNKEEGFVGGGGFDDDD